jgi:shikimate dehydrogenase
VLRPDLWIADIVYRPLVTELLAAARARGCRTMSGARMAVHQAADTFELVTGLAPDRAAMVRDFDALVARETRAAGPDAPARSTPQPGPPDRRKDS